MTLAEEQLTDNEDSLSPATIISLAILSPCLIIAFMGGILLYIITSGKFCSILCDILGICYVLDTNDTDAIAENNDFTELETEADIEEGEILNELLLAGELV